MLSNLAENPRESVMDFSPSNSVTSLKKRNLQAGYGKLLVAHSTTRQSKLGEFNNTLSEMNSLFTRIQEP